MVAIIYSQRERINIFNSNIIVIEESKLAKRAQE